MKPETVELYKKYREFLHLLSNERDKLFYVDENTVDYDKFFEVYNFVIVLHWKIKPYYKNFRRRRSELIKNFEYQKMEMSIRPYFCEDIKKIILTFIY